MTYQEIRKTYQWVLRRYPSTDGLTGRMYDELGTVTTTYYAKRGSRWIETKQDVKAFTGSYYFNTVDAVPFFRGLGGYERVELAYSYAGYIPRRITSINPDRTVRVIREFTFNH